MTVAIAGGNGTLGRRLVAELSNRGHCVRELSRTSPRYKIDLRTGEGIDEAIAGCDAVIDASNDHSRHAAETLIEGSKRLLSAEDAAGVRHHICISVVGCDRVPIGYFRVKAAQERVVAEGPVPWTIVRSTQFHEVIAQRLQAAWRWHVVPVPDVRLQSIASSDAAQAIADVVELGPQHSRLTVAGPKIATARQFARAWRKITREHAVLVPMPTLGKVGSALRKGALTEEHPDVCGTTPFDSWLIASRASLPTLR